MSLQNTLPTPAFKVAMTQTKNALSPFKYPPKLSDIRDIYQSNINHHFDLVQKAAKQDVKIICFGELFTGPYFALEKAPIWRELAEDATHGPTVTTLRTWAKQFKMTLIAPLYEKTKKGEFFNTAVFIEDTGDILGIYRKTHIPHGNNEQGQFLEGFYYQRSDGQLGDWANNISKNPYFPVFQTRYAKIATAICYDRHFEGVMRTLAHQGAQIVFSPAVTFGQKSQLMWPMEFAVDACRHKIFIGGSNRLGNEPPFEQNYFGMTHFVSPNGTLENQSPYPELVISEIDLQLINGPDPSGWNLKRDLRLDIYSY